MYWRFQSGHGVYETHWEAFGDCVLAAISGVQLSRFPPIAPVTAAFCGAPTAPHVEAEPAGPAGLHPSVPALRGPSLRAPCRLPRHGGVDSCP